MFDLREIIENASLELASDIHLIYGLPPVVRLDGKLEDRGTEPLTDEVLMSCAKLIATEQQLEVLKKRGESDFASTFEGKIRMRCNLFYQQGHISIAIRLLPIKIPTVEELLLPKVIIEQAKKPRGLVLVTGQTGSGKSSTLAALIDYINKNSAVERRHVITLESPIEYVYTCERCIIDQREVGSDTESFASGMRAALRQDPDVILVGEMRDIETMSTAITAAETGHLVFATLHTKGAANTIDRIIDAFPSEQQAQIRVQLADVLECAICQVLLPKKNGGRVAAFEVLTGTQAVKSLIRQNKSFQIPSTMETSRSAGMILLDDALRELVLNGEVYPAHALAAANEPDKLKASFVGINVVRGH